MTIASCKRVRRRRLLGIGTVVVAPLVRMMILLMSCTSSCRSGRNSGITWLALIVGQSCCRCCAAVPGVDATTPTTDETDDAGTSASAAAETETAESHFRGKNEEEKPQQLQPDEGDDVMSLPDWRGDDHGDETTQLPIAQGDRPKQVLYDNHHGPRTTIRVGDSVRYDPPFSQYPASVAVVLNRYPQSRGDDDVNDDDSGLLDKADWYLDLGLAHRSALEDDFAAGAKGPQSEGQGVWKQQQQQHERLAITAMLEAASIYEGLLLLYAKPQSAVTMTTTAAANLQHHLAASYFSLAETHALSSFHDFDNNPNSRQRLSTEYFQKAHDLYQQLLLLPQSNYPSKNEREDRLETQVSWAHCCLRLGVALLSRGPDRNHDNTWSSSSSSLPLDPSRLADLLETDGMMDWMDVSDVWGSGGGDGNDNLQHLLSQILRGGGSGGADDRTDSSSRILGSLTQQLGDAEKAMQYFTEAAVVFRQAAETGSTVAERLPHQQSLATTLQNLGTAATTLGDFETSLRRNEEALQLYTNVLMPALQNQQPSGVSEVTDTAIAVSEVLYTLADVYLQLGQHNPAKDRYRQCST